MTNEFDLAVNPAKSKLGVTSVQYLGFCISENGIQLLPEKVEAIVSIPEPKTIIEFRRFLGIINFYRKFIKNAAHLQAPRNEFLNSKGNDKRPVPWIADTEKSLRNAKTR